MPVRSLPLALVTLLVAGCSASDESVTPRAQDLAVAESDASVAVSFDRLTAALEAAGPVGIVAQVDHRAKASGAGLDLRPTRVVLFGNPALGTPLMQANPQAGLDLPQKMLVYEDPEGRTFVAHNTTGYLSARHGVGSVGTLSQIEEALRTFASTAVGSELPVPASATPSVGRDEGVVTVESANDAATTYARLRSAVDANENLTIVAELDHAANAASVGLSLDPTRLIVFGNPALGTPLMQARQTVGVDLPQKMLVYQNAAGDVFVAYNDPAFLAARHRLGTPAQVETMRGALAGLAATAAEADA